MTTTNTETKPEGRARTCGNCRFWLRTFESRRPGKSNGECHLKPPVVLVAGKQGCWPKTKAADWCGCHEPAGCP